MNTGTKWVYSLNRGTGNLQRSMDLLSNPNSLHKCLAVTRNVWPAVEEDLQKNFRLNRLIPAPLFAGPRLPSQQRGCLYGVGPSLSD